MKRLLLPVSLASLLLIACAGLAAADVKVKIAVTPTTIPQCSQAQLFVSVANTGTAPILARICFGLQSGTTVFGPFCGHLALAAGEQRQHEFQFIMPPVVPVGNYAIVLKATASDGTSDQSTAAFSVTAGSCVAPSQAQTTPDAVMNSALQSVGATPEGTTPTQPSTWGRLKMLYR